MKYTKHSVYFFLMLSFLSRGYSNVTISSVPQSSMVPGGIAVIPTPVRALNGSYREERIMLADFEGKQYAIIGIPLSVGPGTQDFSLTKTDGSEQRITFQVQEKSYTEQHLTITNNRQVNPNAEDMQRISRE